MLSLVVVFFHLQNTGSPDTTPSGYVAVLLFYLISGFIISNAFYSSRYSQNYLRLLFNRCLRLFPLLLVVNFIGFFAGGGELSDLNSTIGFTWKSDNFLQLETKKLPIIFLSGFVKGCPPGWSILIELLFYCTLIPCRKKLYLFLILLNIFVIYEGLLIGGMLGFTYIYNNYFGTCGIFCIGVLLQRRLKKVKHNRIKKHAIKMNSVPLFFYMSALIFLPYYFRTSLSIICSCAIFFICGALLISFNLFDSERIDNRFKFWGDLSFTIYLTHTLLLKSFLKVIVTTNQVVNQLLYLALLFMVSTFTLFYFQDPLEKFRKKLSNKIFR